ncbi:MAG: hypothetical protein FJ087_17625 [Deltaproteobacteria bacterium]|nr:hypothetical protein [Deltaproteobacteria bacterium]
MPVPLPNDPVRKKCTTPKFESRQSLMDWRCFFTASLSVPVGVRREANSANASSTVR